MIGLLVMTFFIGNHTSWFGYGHHQAVASSEPESWMTVFIHGSFGSLLGFLNVSDVLKDKVTGTLYRSVTKKMRNDAYFYKDQIILQRGLIPVQPTFDVNEVGDKRYIAYPLIKAYQEVTEAVRPGKEKNYFYTFGWSGLISQNSRRFEAIRLYNALSEEIEKFKARGITPKIRLICHSHGGNLSLNLAAVNQVLGSFSWSSSHPVSPNADENEAVQQMALVMQDLTTKEVAKTKTDQKVYDYVPTTKGLTIDELIMFGNPVQPETESFCWSPTFKRVYNFYSNEDLVQRFDWVSSKKPLSGQRLSKGPQTVLSKAAHIVQARLMAERPVQKGAIVVYNDTMPGDASTVGEQERTIIEEAIAGRNIFARTSKDPIHKEFWCLSWKSEQPSFYLPLPLVVFAPLLVRISELSSSINDADIDLCSTPSKVYACIAPYKKMKLDGALGISKDLIDRLQKHIKQWKYEDESPLAEFNAVYKHVFSKE